MQIKAGWLDEARQVPTKNFNQRPKGFDISLIVIHCISLPPDVFNTPYVDDLFTFTLDKNKHPYFENIYNLELSTHLFIKRDGLITQYVSFLDRAYHAGVSNYQGRERCNDFSIGIELEGSVTQAYTDIQYHKLKAVIELLQKTYIDIKDNIATHSQIAPGRKNDPGPYFDFSRIFNKE